jgi:adenylosuccinate lyase
MEAGKMVKVEGKENDLIDRIKNDSAFKLNEEDLDSLLDAKKYIGRAPEQVVELYEKHIKPILEANADLLGEKGEVNV